MRRDVFSVVAAGADPTGAADSGPGINTALAAAQANVAATGRHSVVFFPAGRYNILVRTGIPAINVSGMRNISFIGTRGLRSRIRLAGDSKKGNWHLFVVRDGSSNIEFRDLSMDMTSMTNPDPTSQNHMFQLGPNCSDVRVFDCEIVDCRGDGVRFLGEFGEVVKDVQILRCRFVNCGRSGISWQRWVQRTTVAHCYLEGGSDQLLDFEPTGYALKADSSGGGPLKLVDTADPPATFITWGIAAGDPIFNVTDNVLCRVLAVDSQTRLTVSAGATTWNDATYYFPLHNSGHTIAHNQLRRDAGGVEILVTLSGSYGVQLVGNQIDGCIQGQDALRCIIAQNSVHTKASNSNTAAINLIKAGFQAQVINNDIVLRNIGRGRSGIVVADQAGRNADSILIEGNCIRAEATTVAIDVEGVRYATVVNNKIMLDSPGDKKSGAISLRATNQNMKSATVTGNEIHATAGTWSSGLSIGADSHNIESVVLGGGIVDDCTIPIKMTEATGVFINPPVLVPGVIGNGSTPVVPPKSKSFVQLAGVGGSAGFTGSFHPGVYWGTGSPEGVLTAGVGSMALRRDGGDGTSVYIKESGTGNTGWVAK